MFNKLTQLIDQQQWKIVIVIISNLIPIFGVIFFHWRTAETMGAYCAEFIAFSFFLVFDVFRIKTAWYNKIGGFLVWLFYFLLISGGVIIFLGVMIMNYLPQESNEGFMVAIFSAIVPQLMLQGTNYFKDRPKLANSPSVAYEPGVSISHRGSVIMLAILAPGFIALTFGFNGGFIIIIALLKIFFDLLKSKNTKLENIIPTDS